MTPDLIRLHASLEQLQDLVDSLELELVDDPRWTEPSDMSYLSEEDRANPDIMANVAAMLATNELIAWFGRDMEGFVGLWQGPKKTPLAEAPVVRLDSEGQYEIVAATVGDYLAISVAEDELDQARDALVAAGFSVAESSEAIWDAAEAFDDPNDYRNTLYESARAKS
jgi:hypothetical protein